MSLKATKFCKNSFKPHQPSMSYVCSFLICTGCGIELKSQYMNVDTNKISTIVFKLVEHLLDHAYTLWMDSLYNCPEPAQFFNYEDTYCVGSLCANRKSIKN